MHRHIGSQHTTSITRADIKNNHNHNNNNALKKKSYLNEGILLQEFNSTMSGSCGDDDSLTSDS